MTPTPQDHKDLAQAPLSEMKEDRREKADKIVISGMSGLYPNSRNVKDFSELLYNKENPVTTEGLRWEFKHPEVSNYSGKVSDLDRFDAQFFKVHFRQAPKMDPMSRKLLELAYEAIYDAGINPKEFNGKNVGVFIATGLSESEAVGFFDCKAKNGFGITGASKTMYANRISYWLNCKSPSVNIDSACCGGMVALEQAVQAIDRGDCDAAIVGSASICLLPQTTVGYNRGIKLAADGKTKSFADNADGCSKSDAINILFLQKSRDALRVYGEVVHVKNEFISRISGKTGQVFGYNRDLNSYTSFLKQFYEEVNVAPDAVEYVEGFGSATPEADKTELQAIDNVFCRNRTDPLLVGSVMSNVGYTEAASGLTAITKVLLGYHTGEIAANLHCERPRQDVTALREGRMQVVTDHKPLRSTYTAVNSLSFTGINSHVLLKGHFKPKDVSRYNSAIPRLVIVSTRIDITLSKIFEDLKSRPVDPEEIALLHNIHANNIPGHLGRGYIVLDTTDEQKTVSLGEQAQYVNDADRPLWFVYSGMGSQWTAMGAQLMRIPIFAAAIERCQKVLEPFGIDVLNIITSTDETLLKNIQNTFVGIAAIQIGLTDILKELGLIPDKIIGHSVGELGCAYADGCLTAEEMIMSAYYRGRVSLETKFIRGAMAAVGLGYQQISKICPPEIDVACHNSPQSSTISGPAEKITEFTGKLTADGIFAKKVPTSNIAYHSRYIATAGPSLLQNLSGLITHPKPRSDKWVSTSVPQERWHEPIAKLCSAEYLTNNLLSPVLFEETSQLIPSNALLVEIAPHGLLQAILKKSLPETCKNIALTKRGHKDNAVFLLNAIGQVYVEGFSPKLQVLYPKVEFPVSTGTPHLSHHVEWMHGETWDLSVHEKTTIKKAASCNFLINLHNVEHSYLEGNVIRGKVVYPFAAALVAAWDTLVMSLGASKKSKSVQFRDLHLYSQPILHDSKQLKLSVFLHRGTGLFDILDGRSKVISGFISTYDGPMLSDSLHQLKTNLDIGSEEVYENLSSRGYGYRGDFRSIAMVNEDITEAEIIWNDNWVTLIDGMLQLNTLKHNSGVVQPYQIRELTIDVLCSIQNKSRVLKATIDPIIDDTSCGGVVMRNIKFRNVAIESPEKITLELLSPTSTKNVNQLGKKMNKYVEEQRLSLEISNVGDINTLHWKEVGSIPTNDIKVKVQYAGLNVTDIKRASGVLPFDDDTTCFGMDFSGLTESGDRVMGLVKNGAVSTIVTVRPDLMWPVPSYWSLEDAATVPLAYAQAFYCMKIKNRLEKNSRVLIHGGAGALGQAAISIALAMECEIFTTVADQSKKRFLLKLFPQLKEEHIGNSRDSSFADIVLNATNSEGCDIILSCVKDDLRNECLKCTAHYGTTVDTSLLQSRDDFVYGMSYMTRCRSFMAVDFKSIFEPDYSADLKHIQELVSEGIAQGYVRPLSRVTYAPGEAQRAFRLLTASRHRGRVLLRLRDQPLARPRINCTSELCHVIFCDDNLAALQVADRLISRGATKLRMHCFNSSSTNALKIRSWKAQGVKAHATFGLLSADDILKIFNECEQIEGIYVMVSNNASNFKEMKAIVDQITGAARASCPQLKYFAVASIDSNIGKEACFAQSVNGLQKTIIIPDLIRVNKEYNMTIDVPTWNRIVVDAIERALLCDYPVLVAKTHLLEQMSLLQQLGSIAGIGNLFSYDDDTTLKDLNIENEELNIIKLYLQDTYNVTLEIEEIRELTKNKIRQIELSTIGEDFKDIRGLSCFFSYVDLDELQGTAEFQLMETSISSIAGNELDMNEKYLSIVTGIEGHHDRFHSMCTGLKLQAIVLQPGLDYLTETPKELAYRYSKILLNKLGVKDYFYLLGYEYGVTVALELAAILEANGKTGTVFLIGDTPNGIRAQIEEQIAGYSTETALQVEIISHMFRLMSVEDKTLLTNAMKGCSSWEERASACVSALIGQVSHSAQYTRAVLDAAYTRITTARTYNFTAQKIKSKIVLMRAKSAIRKDTTLQQLSEQPVDVYELAAPLAHATKDIRCTAIINKYLSDDLLEAFESSNTCIPYAME